jgi:hypothetical protein
MKTLDEVMLDAVPTANSTERIEYVGFYFEDEDESDDCSDRLSRRTWLEVDVPIELFGCKFTNDELGVMFRDPWQQSREKEREAAILDWVEQKGGWQEALKESPIVAAIESGLLCLIDGWHRAKLARLRGETTVCTLVGVQWHEQSDAHITMRVDVSL